MTRAARVEQAVMDCNTSMTSSYAYQDVSLQISNSVVRTGEEIPCSDAGLTNNFEHCKSISDNSLRSYAQKTSGDISILRKSHMTQSSNVLSERTLNLKNQIGRLDDEII